MMAKNGTSLQAHPYCLIRATAEARQAGGMIDDHGFYQSVGCAAHGRVKVDASIGFAAVQMIAKLRRICAPVHSSKKALAARGRPYTRSGMNAPASDCN
jgi:hypothetical protein